MLLKRLLAFTQATWFWPCLIIVLYLVTHLINLVGLPVFADEAIYIRWAQLIIDDWQRYLFFAMNDGKTPLFIWTLVPFQFMSSDQLWNARFSAVLVGLLQVGVMYVTVGILGGSRRAQRLSALLTTFLPFWFFHHRMALIDGLLCVGLTLIIACLALMHRQVVNKEKWWSQSSKVWMWWLLAGLSLGLSLWTKFPAILFLPLFVVSGVFLPKAWPSSLKALLPHVLLAGSAAGIGLVFFILLKFTPQFGQLFSRGGDFLYPLREILLEAKWKYTLPNFPTYFGYFLQYATWPIVLASVSGLFSKTHQRMHHFLWLGWLGFCLPIAFMGKVVYPRYFMPGIVFMTISAALVINEWLEAYVFNNKNIKAKVVVSLIAALFAAHFVTLISMFVLPAWINPNIIPLTRVDQNQYLQEWSSGHGITETVALIQERSRSKTVAVATEGYFGTLPDGLVLYFHRQPVDNLYIDGIGQPVRSLDKNFVKRAKEFDETLLVVNSNRLMMFIPGDKLIKEYCRPSAAEPNAKPTCLQVWDITEQVKAASQE